MQNISVSESEKSECKYLFTDNTGYFCSFFCSRCAFTIRNIVVDIKLDSTVLVSLLNVNFYTIIVQRPAKHCRGTTEVQESLAGSHGP